MSSGWDNYREAINHKWLLETPYNALKCFTDAKLERYELSINRKLSLEERKKMRFEVKLLSPLKMNPYSVFIQFKDGNYPDGGYSSLDFCLLNTESPSVEWLPKPGLYVYDFYNFKEYNNFFDFSFHKFIDTLGHDIISNVYNGLIDPEEKNCLRIIDRRYFVQEYELIRRMLFISRNVYSYLIGKRRAIDHNGYSYLYDIYFNNASETTVKRYEDSEKKFNDAIEEFKNEEEKFYPIDTFEYTLVPHIGYGYVPIVSYLEREYDLNFSVLDNSYNGEYSSYLQLPYCRVNVIPIKKVRCIIVNKYGVFTDFRKEQNYEKWIWHEYTESGSFILNDGTLLNKENSIFITFDDFIDSNDTQEDIDNKVIRKKDLIDLFLPVVAPPSKSEFEDYNEYLYPIIPNPPYPTGWYSAFIKNKLFLSNNYIYYSYTQNKRVVIDSYVIGCYDYLAGGELEFDDDGLYSSGDSSSDNNEEKDTTDNIETNNNTES